MFGPLTRWMVAVQAGKQSSIAPATIRQPRLARACFTRLLLARRTSVSQGAAAPRRRRRAALRPGPVTDRAGVAVNELRVRVEADAPHPQRADVVQHLPGSDAADAEVDRRPLHVLAVARDLVSLLAQHEV